MSFTADDGFVLAGLGEEYGGELFFVKSDSGGTYEWNKTLGDPDEGWFTSIIQTSDNGFVAAGSKGDNDDFFLVKTNSSAHIEWESTIPREGDPCSPIPQVIQATDGGLLISGWHNVEGQGGAMLDWDIELIKTTPIQDIKVNSTFGFSALLILVVLCGFSTHRRRR